MPVYEYRCDDCRRRSSLFFLTLRAAADTEPRCDHCGSTRVRKLVSLFTAPRSEEERLDELADPAAFGDVDEDDPKSVARWARRMGKEMGEDLGPEYDEMVDAIERGDDVDDAMGMNGDMGGAADGLDDL